MGICWTGSNLLAINLREHEWVKWPSFKLFNLFCEKHAKNYKIRRNMFLIPLPYLISLVAQMVILFITHNGPSDIALNYSICIFRLNCEPPSGKWTRMLVHSGWPFEKFTYFKKKRKKTTTCFWGRILSSNELPWGRTIN